MNMKGLEKVTESILKTLPEVYKTDMRGETDEKT